MSDVTKSAERAARLEWQLSQAQQITHIGSWEWDLETNAIVWSDELYRIYGLEPGSRTITFEFFLSCLVPEDRERVVAEVGKAREGGGRFGYRERIVRPDGSVRVLDTIGEVMNFGGKPSALVGTCRDVTDERKREERFHLYQEIVRNVQIALFVWQLGTSEDDVRLVAANAAADRAATVQFAHRTGERIGEIFPEFDFSDFRKMLREVSQAGTVREVTEYRFKGPDNNAVFDLKIFPLSDGCVGVAAEDVTARARARELQSAERRVLEMIASGGSLERVLEIIVTTIESLSVGTVASILLLDPDGLRLRHGSAPSMPAAFNRAVDGAPIGPRAGSCGTAAFERRTVIVRDVLIDPLWEAYRELAVLANVRSCWSTPLIATDGSVLGTFALYYREPHDPTPLDVELVGRAAHIAQIAIKRHVVDDQMRALSGHIESAREEERRGIARELHDELGQGLTGIKLDASWIVRRARDAKLDGRLLQEKLEGIMAVVDGLIQRVRKISSELRPGVLDDLGLLDAVEWQCREFQKRTGAACRFESSVENLDIEPTLATAFFRILQESLTNVARHANASRVDVHLECTPECIILTVTDDGGGISERALASSSSLGLLGIRERARRFGGDVTIARARPNGTRIRAEAPLRRASQRPPG